MSYNEDKYIDEIDDLEYESDENQVDNQYLIISIFNSKYALPIKNLKEISLLPEVRPYPDMKKHEKGLFKLRDETVYVIDLRQRLGYSTLEEQEKEMLRHLDDAKKYHYDWISELKLSLKEDREFKLARDPHHCAFGQWYYNFETTSISLKTYLSQFEMPHTNIHRVADKAITMRKEVGLDAALELVDKIVANDLQTMIELNKNAVQEIKDSKREIVVILDINGSLTGFTADYVDSIININDEEIDYPNENLEKSKFMKGSFKTNNEVFVILNPEKLY